MGGSIASDTATSFEVGTYIAYRDTDDPDSDDSKRYHIGKVINIADGQAHVHCYSTHDNALSRAKWEPLYQNDRGVYDSGNRTHGDAVIDQIPVEEQDWVMHYDVKINLKDCLTKRTRKQLTDMKVTHHRLGHTFP